MCSLWKLSTWRSHAFGPDGRDSAEPWKNHLRNERFRLKEQDRAKENCKAMQQLES